MVASNKQSNSNRDPKPLWNVDPTPRADTTDKSTSSPLCRFGPGGDFQTTYDPNDGEPLPDADELWLITISALGGAGVAFLMAWAFLRLIEMV